MFSAKSPRFEIHDKTAPMALNNACNNIRGAQYYWLQLGHDGGGINGDR